MPAFNADRFIDAAIRSLLAERDAVDLDIIVVDDGSTDATRPVVESLAADFPEVRLLQNPRKGIAAARNTGLDHIRDDCRFVAFLDADDLSVPGRIERQRSLLAGDPGIDVLYGLVKMFSIADESQMAPAAQSATKIIRGPYLQSAMYRPQVIRSVGRFDETFRQGCDTDFVLRVIEREFNLVLDDGLACYYRRHDANVTLNVQEMQREFMLASLKWAARNRMKGKVEVPKVFSEMFLRRDKIEEGFGA
ncbi:glycosyltransferase family A protein [Mesorhizobium sp. KR9-304]|uniref:glycosyltransferase family 2 protein n=1 Tax=Mesorhizobium sp. KR9-304 TaxID=3156614 RepID=UPI0032B3C21B